MGVDGCFGFCGSGCGVIGVCSHRPGCVFFVDGGIGWGRGEGGEGRCCHHNRPLS